MASIKPGIASWSSVASPLAELVETTFPRSLNTLMAELAGVCVEVFSPEWHPANATKASNEQASDRRITATVYYRPLAARVILSSGTRTARYGVNEPRLDSPQSWVPHPWPSFIATRVGYLDPQ